MNNALVSVIIPVYNRADTIQRAIDSVLCQTYENLELLIVDDGSTDNTVEIAKTYMDKRIRIICQEHGGANKARNTGIANAKGDYIAFQDSDDAWHADKLDTQVNIMRVRNYSACYSAYNLHKDHQVHTVPVNFEDRNRYQEGLNEILKERNVVGTPTLIFKREVLTLMGNELFDEQMPRLQDYDFVIRLFKVCRLAYVNRPLVDAFRTKDSISDAGALYEAAGRIVEKHSDFLNVEKFIDFVVSIEAGIDMPQKLIEDIDLFQKKAGVETDQCKDKMLMSISSKYAIQNKLLSVLYNSVVHNLQNKRFTIYGAGTIGYEVYRGLQKKGLQPVCFLVTRCESKQYIDDIPVISIDDYQNREDMVIVSIALENQMELIDNLIARNYKQFCIFHS